ncbi:hypothetical protein [Methanobrevibacter gottschalkii]|uniref:hypothetical protein n=1 Tax=Methanobrevibacter gottschalkii TaxID=190974 RepID=UPI0026F367FC|nr:hypothetical protein [Methanobrevibacter gottschalkii]
MQSKLEKYIVLISFISSIVGVFVINGVIIGVPDIAREFGMNNELKIGFQQFLYLQQSY